jgi:hypothetical protein
MPLVDLMSVTTINKDDYSWLRCTIPHDSESFRSAARELAGLILRLRCGTARAHDVWMAAVEDGYTPTKDEKSLLAAFVRPGFGTPIQPLPDDHVEGMAAEYLWYFVSLEQAAHQGLDVARIEAPSPSPSTSGGDGLIILREGDQHSFCLWEIKKSTGVAPVSSSVNRAYGQLQDKALEYLARYIGPASMGAAGDDALLAAIGTMVDDWISGSPRAGAGVAVATSVAKAPSRCFSTFPAHFPHLAPRLTGTVYAIGDFQGYALAVRNLLWTGL